jgi:hypothetical protein
MPTRKPARIIEMAFAPTAGAKGVEPDEPAPIAHDINALASPATTSVASTDTATIVPGVIWQPSRGYRLPSAPENRSQQSYTHVPPVSLCDFPDDIEPETGSLVCRRVASLESVLALAGVDSGAVVGNGEPDNYRM